MANNQNLNSRTSKLAISQTFHPNDDIPIFEGEMELPMAHHIEKSQGRVWLQWLR
jgi:hypothetical protein